MRVYLTNVEKICRRFLEERRGKLGKLIGDKARWSRYICRNVHLSFLCSFSVRAWKFKFCLILYHGLLFQFCMIVRAFVVEIMSQNVFY